MKLARLALTGIVVGSLLAVDAAYAEPDAVRAAKSRLDALSEQVSAAEQDGIEAQSRADDAKRRLERATSDLRAQEARVAKLSDELGEIAVQGMQQGHSDVMVQLFSSADEDQFLRSLSTIQAETNRSNASLQQLQVDQARLDQLRGEADAAKREIDENLRTKERKLSEYKEKQAEAEQVFNRLNREEQQRLERLRKEQERRAEEQAQRRAQADAITSRDTDRTTATANRANASGDAAATATTPGTGAGNDDGADTSWEQTPAAAPASSGSVQTVIDAAMAQVGKPYRYGSSGPSAFDCSGLTGYAYRKIGISLPRSSRAQYSGAGRRVSTGDIQPGDLVFYYSGPSHVGIYIGGGKIVHAANPRSGINVTGLHTMPLKGVRRVL